MLCVFGVVAAQWNETHATPMQEKCPEDPLFKVSAMAGRSFGDTFGAAVTGDVMYVGISYMAMFVYLVCTLSRRDHVHSAWGMTNPRNPLHFDILEGGRITFNYTVSDTSGAKLVSKGLKAAQALSQTHL